jgi:hypothetical protein
MKNEAFFVFTVNSESLSFFEIITLEIGDLKFCVLQQKHVPDFLEFLQKLLF